MMLRVPVVSSLMSFIGLIDWSPQSVWEWLAMSVATTLSTLLILLASNWRKGGE